jgi:hypothetical protein
MPIFGDIKQAERKGERGKGFLFWRFDVVVEGRG